MGASLLAVAKSIYITFLFLTFIHVGIDRDCQERLLIVFGNSKYFLIPSLQTCWYLLAESKTLINGTWHISILPYP